MITRRLIVFALFATAGCGDGPARDSRMSDDATADVGKEQVAERKRSIEEAAEEATKLIEADAKAEVNTADAELADN